jgi:hypothetical protein
MRQNQAVRLSVVGEHGREEMLLAVSVYIARTKRLPAAKTHPVLMRRMTTILNTYYNRKETLSFTVERLTRSNDHEKSLYLTC